MKTPDSGYSSVRRVAGSAGVYLAILLVLLVARPATEWMGRRAVMQVRRDIGYLQERLVLQGGAALQDRFLRIQGRMRSLADRVAAQPVVQAALAAVEQEAGARGDQIYRHNAIRWFDQLKLPAHTAVEVVTTAGEPVAWSGFTLDVGVLVPVLAAEGAVTRVISDRTGLQAIVLDHPVPGTTGTVRVVRLIRMPARATGSFVGSLDLTEEMTEALAVDVQLEFGESQPPTAMPGPRLQRSFALPALNGSDLGIAVVTAPVEEESIGRIARRYADVAAFWSALLLVWLLTGIWMLFRAEADHPGSSARPHRSWKVSLLVGLLLAGLVGLRYGLLWLDVPARWFPNAVLFDPRRLASTLAAGVAQSIGDLLLSVAFLLAGALFLMRYTITLTFPDVRNRSVSAGELLRLVADRRRRPSWIIFLFGSVLWLGWMGAMAIGLAVFVRRVILDSTLDYFAWTGLAPEPLVLLVFTGLVTAALAAIFLISAVARLTVWCVAPFRPARLSSRSAWLLYGAALLAVAAFTHHVSGAASYLPWWTGLLLVLVGVGLSAWDLLHAGERERLLFLNSSLAILLLVMAVVYPLVYRGMIIQRDIRMEEVADDYVAKKGEESRIVVEEVLGRAARWEASQESTVWPSIEAFITSPPLPFHHDYGVTVFLFEDDLGLLASARTEGAPLSRQSDSWEPIFRDLYRRWPSERENGWLMARLEEAQESKSVVDCGLSPLQIGPARLWLLVAAAPRTFRFARQDPDDLAESLRGYPDWRRRLSIAEYEAGRLVRTEGPDFGRTHLPYPVQLALQQAPEIWRVDELYGQAYATFYRRQAGLDAPGGTSVVAVRSRATVPNDHLYYLLRIAVGGLFVVMLFYVGGLVLRLRDRRIPHAERRFGARILNAFLGVGAVTVLLTGWFGQNVILRENQGAIQSRLERRLERVEQALVRVAGQDESLASVIARVSLDTLAAELSLDLNVYRQGVLWRSSTTDEQQQLLQYSRLPIQAYEDIYVEGYRRSYVTLNEGTDAVFTIGYLALAGEDGTPDAVVSVLTIPEQERIREERARTSAYLFGSLLLLLIIVMATATLLANRLGTPLRRLRSGLSAVAEGRFSRPIPVGARDELGTLVETFNAMQDQLADSRRKLAQQERELAWREMAKQVAHEIKNPLTPMKLSIQHLQRAFLQDGRTEDTDPFARLFRRITGSLTEQIDALANIANEFYTFARLPVRHIEVLELTRIIRDAADLLDEESSVPIHLDLPRAEIGVEADREELIRVYINLLKNAVQAIPDGKDGRVTVTARVEETEGGEMAVSTVCDTGSGIPPEIQDRIFQPNFSTKTSGMGLGLAIVKQSVEAMGGSIMFETAEGSGTKFTLSLPLAHDKRRGTR